MLGRDRIIINVCNEFVARIWGKVHLIRNVNVKVRNKYDMYFKIILKQCRLNGNLLRGVAKMVLNIHGIIYNQ